MFASHDSNLTKKLLKFVKFKMVEFMKIENFECRFGFITPKNDQKKNSKIRKESIIRLKGSKKVAEKCSMIFKINVIVLKLQRI